MNKQEITDFIKKNIQYKDWEFYVGDKNGAVYMQIKFNAPDHANPEQIEKQHCRKWLLSEWMTVTEIVQTCWAAVIRAELHEAAELFKYRGHDIYNNHLSVDALTEICTDGAYEHRGDPKISILEGTEPFPKKYQEALSALYEQHGVGNTFKQKRAFWNMLQPNTNITHVETDEEWTKAFELGWLCDQFPQDFPLA